MGSLGDCSNGGPEGVVRIAAMSDVHCKVDSRGTFRPTFTQISKQADVLIVCGDLTHFGLIEELKVFLDEVEPALENMPVLAVLGNHDFESNRQDEILVMLAESGVTVLDGNCVELCGVGFTGIKGFGGGFGKRALQPWGEAAIKNFVNEVAKESDKLDAALATMNSGPRIVLMHYAPIRATIEGEAPEIFAFLGSSRLEEALNRHAVTAVFHGHAHEGYYAGRTSTDIPVFNVSVAVLKQNFPGRPPFFMFEVPVPKLVGKDISR